LEKIVKFLWHKEVVLFSPLGIRNQGGGHTPVAKPGKQQAALF
jgi:hypothetical protein